MTVTLFIYSDLFTTYYGQGTDGNLMCSTNVPDYHELVTNMYKWIFKS